MMRWFLTVLGSLMVYVLLLTILLRSVKRLLLMFRVIWVSSSRSTSSPSMNSMSVLIGSALLFPVI